MKKIPGIGGLHGKNKGRPSSITPVNRLQMGFTPKSGRLFPTLTTIVASFCFAEIENIDFKKSDLRGKDLSHIVRDNFV